MKNKNNQPFESMIKNFALFDRSRAWTPIKIEEIENIFSLKHEDQEDYYIEKQIQYNLQYLEFLQKIINELFLTGNLPKMVYKNYIIIAVGIIENCFYYVLKKDNYKKYKDLSFGNMIDILERKNILNYDVKVFPIFSVLKELRNYVHIFIGARENTSDFYTIKEEYYLLAKYTLNRVLTKIGTLNLTFNFLECSDHEIKQIGKLLNALNLL